MAKKVKISDDIKFFFNKKYNDLFNVNYSVMCNLEDEELFNYLTLEIFKTFEIFDKKYEDTEKTILEYLKKSYRNDNELFITLNEKYGNFFSTCGYDFSHIFIYIYSKYNFVRLKLQSDNNTNTINLLDEIKRKDPKVIEACINEKDEEIFNLDKYLTITEIKNFIPRNYKFYDDVSFTARFFLSENSIDKTVKILKEELKKKNYRSDFSRKMQELYTKKEKFILMLFFYYMNKRITYREMKILALNKLKVEEKKYENFNSSDIYAIENKFMIYQRKLDTFFDSMVDFIKSSEKNDLYVANRLYKFVQNKYIDLINELFLMNIHFFDKHINKKLIIESELIIEPINLQSEKKQYFKNKLELIEKLSDIRKIIISCLELYLDNELKNVKVLISKMKDIKIHTTLPKYDQQIKELKQMLESNVEYLSIFYNIK